MRAVGDGRIDITRIWNNGMISRFWWIYFKFGINCGLTRHIKNNEPYEGCVKLATAYRPTWMKIDGIATTVVVRDLFTSSILYWTIHLVFEAICTLNVRMEDITCEIWMPKNYISRCAIRIVIVQVAREGNNASEPNFCYALYSWSTSWYFCRRLPPYYALRTVYCVLFIMYCVCIITAAWSMGEGRYRIVIVSPFGLSLSFPWQPSWDLGCRQSLQR